MGDPKQSLVQRALDKALGFVGLGKPDKKKKGYKKEDFPMARILTKQEAAANDVAGMDSVYGRQWRTDIKEGKDPILPVPEVSSPVQTPPTASRPVASSTGRLTRAVTPSARRAATPPQRRTGPRRGGFTGTRSWRHSMISARLEERSSHLGMSGWRPKAAAVSNT